MRRYQEATVQIDLDELVFLSFSISGSDNNQNNLWEATDKGRIILNQIFAETFQNKEMLKLHGILLEKQRRDKKKEKQESDEERVINVQEATG